MWQSWNILDLFIIHYNKVPRVVPDYIMMDFHKVACMSTDMKEKEIVNILLTIYRWGIWKRRNRNRYDNKELTNAFYNDVIMGAIASQITTLTIVYPTLYSEADQRKHQSSASLAFVRGIHRGSGTSPHKWLVTRKMLPFDDVIMKIVVIVIMWNTNSYAGAFNG